MSGWHSGVRWPVPTFAEFADDIADLRRDLAGVEITMATGGSLSKAYGQALAKAFDPVLAGLAVTERRLRELERREAVFFPAAAGRGTAPKPPRRPMLRIVK